MVAAIAKHVPLAAPPAPDAPGPFAFADAARVRGILERAGFRAVKHEPVTGELSLGQTLDEALSFATEIGPAGSALRDASASQRAAAIAAIRETLVAKATPQGVRMGYATWIVTAEH